MSTDKRCRCHREIALPGASCCARWLASLWLCRSPNGRRFLPGRRHPHEGMTSSQHLILLRLSFRLRMTSFWTIWNASNFLFFWEQANPQTGLIKDRCNVHINDTGVVASIASTGFGLTAICIGEKRGYISHQDARLRVIATLVFLWRKLPTHRGFFYHFANINTGERIWDSEVSSVDTAILLCGILTCRQHFQDRDIIDLAHAIFDRVDWTWLSEDTDTVAPWLDAGVRLSAV